MKTPLNKNSYNAFKNAIHKPLTDLSDCEHLLWYALKHNLSIEDAESYFSKEADKREKKFVHNGFSFYLKLDAYYFQNILKVSNKHFDVIEQDMPLKMFNDKGTYEKCDFWIPWKYKSSVKQTYYRYNGYAFYGYLSEAIKKSQLSEKTLDNLGLSLFSHKNLSITYTVGKPCNYCVYCTDILKCKHFNDGTILSMIDERNPIDPIEPITIYLRHSVARTVNYKNPLNKVKANYVALLTYMYKVFKCLDEIDNTYKISYEDFSSPIYNDED